MDKKLFDEMILKLETTHDSKGNKLNISTIIVSENNDVYSHCFGEKVKVDVRSIAKPIVCLAFGVAIERGLYLNGIKIDLNTKIGPLVSSYVKISDENLKIWNELTVRDCFKITLGHDKGIMFSKDVKEHNENDLIEYVMNYPITRRPGIDFVYSNAGTFILSTIITEHLGISLKDFVDKMILSPLGIEDYEWKNFGKYCAGCTGLKMYCEDLHKIALLLLNKGVYNNKRIVSEKWINNMTLPLVPMPTHRYKAGRAYPKLGYGLNLWICGDIDDNGIISTNGIYYCDGTDGQYIICIPYKNMAIAVTAFQPDTEPVSSILGMLK